MVLDLGKDVDNIDKSASLIQAKLQQTERQAQDTERKLAHLSREEQTALYEHQVSEAAKRDKEREEDRRSNYIKRRSEAIDTNMCRTNAERLPSLAAQ